MYMLSFKFISQSMLQKGLENRRTNRWTDGRPTGRNDRRQYPSVPMVAEGNKLTETLASWNMLLGQDGYYTLCDYATLCGRSVFDWLWIIIWYGISTVIKSKCTHVGDPVEKKIDLEQMLILSVCLIRLIFPHTSLTVYSWYCHNASEVALNYMGKILASDNIGDECQFYEVIVCNIVHFVGARATNTHIFIIFCNLFGLKS